MPNQTQLVDRSHLTHNRARAKRIGGDFFLHNEVQLEIKDRLSMVNKSFTSPAIVTGFPELWQDWFPNATVVADTDTLSLKEGAHDFVIHALCLHWASDPVGQLIQCNRALKPDGLMLTALFGDQTLHELRASLAQAEINLRGGLSPRVLPMAELRDLGGLLQRASFAMPVADKITQTVSFSSLNHLISELRAMAETSALFAKPKTIPPRKLFADAQEIYAQNYSEEGRILATFDMIFLTGWAPDDSQPKPLLPGSAKTRLADALAAQEFNLPRDTRSS
jgi:SAM-dependent methyltransferase